MWNVVIGKYLGSSNVYFDIMNEPEGYSASAEDNVAAAWVAHFSRVPRGRVIVPGAGFDQNLCTVGADARLAGTLLSIHDYTLGGETHPTEPRWGTSFEHKICGYDSQAVLTSQTQGPGPCENASCAITSLYGSALNYTLSVNDQPGIDRLHYGWGTSGWKPGSNATGPPGQ